MARKLPGAAGAYQYCSVHKIGGGFLGGLLAGIFCPNFGLLGSYVIDVVAVYLSGADHRTFRIEGCAERQP